MRYEEIAFTEYERWLKETVEDRVFHSELKELADNQQELIESFYREMDFGTSGLRGIIGSGTNRINKYVVRRVTIAVARYLVKKYENPSVVISYDSRRYSREFAQLTAAIFSGAGIKTWIFPELAPVSLLSYAIGELNCNMGIMITASHNPKIFNGYKIYSESGYQIVGEVLKDIKSEMTEIDYFSPAEVSTENIEKVPVEVEKNFLKRIETFLPEDISDKAREDIKIVYTPLNGAGGKYVKELLRRKGFKNTHTVPLQDFPDENFTTCPIPNPEKLSAYEEGFNILDKEEADIVIATDPDSDRAGAAIIHKGMKRNISGNSLGILMLDFLCNFSQIPENGFIMKSIVTTPLAEKIAEKYGLETVSTLTGFKYIGEKITELMEAGEEDRFFIGFEESNSFLVNPFIRDKDGVSAAVIIAFMAAWYKEKGIDLLDRLDLIYEEYGTCIDKTRNYIFEGREGEETRKAVMQYFRNNVNDSIDGCKIIKKSDYLIEETGLPAADAISFDFEDGTSAVIRPSGTEPKIKLYLFLSEAVAEPEKALIEIMKDFK